jgi:hypothetical protein
VAARLMVGLIADFAKCFHGVPAGEDRETAHRLTSTISSVIGGGTGSPCFRRLSR